MREKESSTLAAEDMATTLASEGAEMKKEGWMYKLVTGITGTGIKRWKRKWFVLNNGRLG